MAHDITIYPAPPTGYPRIEFEGADAGAIRLEVHDDGSVHFIGAAGTLLSLVDSLSGVLHSVNNISGLPVLEVNSDNSINMGEYGNYGFQMAADGDLGLGGTVTIENGISNQLTLVGRSSDNYGGMTFSNNAGTDSHQIQSTGAKVWLYRATGNVRFGVNMNSPAYELDVGGDINASSHLRVGGTDIAEIYSPIAGSASITTVGTIGTGVWQGTAIAAGYMAAHTPQSHALTAHTGSLTAANITDVAPFSQSGTYASLRAQATTYGDVGAAPAAGNSSIVTVGTIGTGTWQGTAIAAGYMAAHAPQSHAFSVHSGTLGVSQGGTGAGTHTSGNVLIGAGTGAITSLSRSGIDSRTSFPSSAHDHTNIKGSTSNLDTSANYETGAGRMYHQSFSSGATGEPPTADNANSVLTMVQHSGGYTAQLAFSSDGAMYHRDNPVLTTGTWNKVWTAGTDGSGSGLDADKLDGQEGAYYAVAGAAPTSHAFSVHSGTLGVTQGGTGVGTHTSGQVLIGAGTGAITTLSRSGIDSRSTFPSASHAFSVHSGINSVPDGGTGVGTHTSGAVLIGGGTGNITTLSRSGIDSRSTFPATSHAFSVHSGTLGVSQGGTGAGTHTSGNVLIGAGTGAVTSLTRAGIDTAALSNSTSSEQIMSGSEVRVQSTDSTEKFTLRYNETDDTLEIVFVST
jgi:hypothetical protein